MSGESVLPGTMRSQVRICHFSLLWALMYSISIDLVTRRRRWVWYVTLQLRMKVAGRITFIRIGSNDGDPSGFKLLLPAGAAVR